jgi:hypothetical protein
MQGGGIMPAGSGCALRLDPLALPIRFYASDAGADERVRVEELHRERVVLRRRLRGMSMAVNLPVRAFLGIALRVLQSAEAAGHRVSISLEHGDPALTIPLYTAADSDDVVAEWQSWARALRMPLLIVDGDGVLHQPFPCVGQVRSGPSAPRRRGRSSLKRRRSSIAAKRRKGGATAGIHRGEREITPRE